MPDGPLRVVSSRQNPRVKQLRAALARSGRTPEGLLAIEGEHLVAEAAASGLRFATLFLRSGEPRRPLPAADELLLLSPDVFASAAATDHPAGIAALVEPPAFLPEALLAGTPLLLVLAGVQDPGNVGTLLRSAEAFAATGVLLLPGTASPWNPKALRASAGSAFRVPALALDEGAALNLLARHGIAAIAAVPREGAEPEQVPLRPGCALLVGNEGAGLGAELLARAAHRVTLPMPGRVESLNAAVAGSLLLYEASRQRRHPIRR